MLFVKEGYWRFYIQGYVKYSDNATAIAQNSGQKYTEYYKNWQLMEQHINIQRVNAQGFI